MNHRPAQALTIAGSDSSGGAGIQADLKTMTRWGVEGASVVTALTAQNTLGVTAVRVTDSELFQAQLDAVLADNRLGAAKTGMLANAAIIETLNETLTRYPDLPLVIDPVMVATSGARLLEPAAEHRLFDDLLPRACLVTPNLPEAAALTGLRPEQPAEKLAEALMGRGCRAVLIKGGHAQGGIVEDLLMTENGATWFRHPRKEVSIHGTGCTLSAAITAGIALGLSLEDAVARSIEWLQHLIARAYLPMAGELALLPIASGPSPVRDGA